MSKTWFGHYIENIKGDDYVLFTDYVELEQKIDRLNNELDQYKNNWEELKEHLNNGINYWEEQEKEWIEQGFMKFGGEANTKIIYQGILNKMKELEEKNND